MRVVPGTGVISHREFADSSAAVKDSWGASPSRALSWLTWPSRLNAGTAQPGVAALGTAEPGAAEPGAAEPGAAEAGEAEPGEAEPKSRRYDVLETHGCDENT